MDRYPYYKYTILLGATRALARIGVYFIHHDFRLSPRQRTRPTGKDVRGSGFGVGRESSTKSRQTLNTRSGLKRSRSISERMGDKLHRREGNNPDHQLRPLNYRSVIKKV